MPNAGKSSLLNRLMGSKLSIVTPFAQTTRERVVGIDTRGGVQMIFLDTPGIVTPAYLLHSSMVEIIQGAVADADVVVLLLDGTRAPPEFPAGTLAAMTARGQRVVPVINKMDEARQKQIQRLLEWSEERLGERAEVVSATRGDGVDALRARIADHLPESPLLYPGDELSTQSMRFFVSELIRETVFERYQEEIPYSAAVRIEEFREAAEPIFIRAVLYVERESQKGIIIGKGGAGIRELGSAARSKIEEFAGARVYLDLWVKVLPRWRKDPVELGRLGFPIPRTEN
jgi:GTP-binding protein Era